MDESDLFEKRIADFRERNPGKMFHINENNQVVKGPIHHKYCQLCGKNIEEIRDDNPRRRLTKFCSTNCKVEYERRDELRESLLADSVIWTTYKGKTYPKRNTIVAVYQRQGKNPIQVPVIGRKGNFLIVQV